MKHQISTSINIQADSSVVWKVLTGFKDYPKWNPFIKSIVGEIEVGRKFKAEIDTMKFKPKTLVFDENQEFTWIGRFILPGIFDGKHSFILRSNDDGTTTLYQKEYFNGLLVGLMRKKLDTDIISKFNLMNQKLKDVAERETLNSKFYSDK